MQQAQSQRPFWRSPLVLGVALLATLVLLLALVVPFTAAPVGGQRASFAVLVPAVFLAGLLSFLSPCTLPILPAYFAFTFQSRQQSIVLTTVAFFLGLATTMTLLGASATALGNLVGGHRQALTFWGGLLIIGFGLMSLFGKGFSGIQVAERPAASVLGSYIYGATFALGWTACLGPILGTLLGLLFAAEGIGVLPGALLAFVYALGLGMPLILVATFFSRLGSGSRFWRFMRGYGFELRLFGRSLYLHSTSIASGLLLIGMGYLLASGKLYEVSQLGETTPFGRWVIEGESWLSRLFGL